MAFAAIHPEAGRIDATLPDLGRGLTWDQVHKTRPRVALRCPECGHGVHAKVSARKLRYFAHDPGRPTDCAWLNESLEHHLLKLELATAIRAADWHAELEVRAPDGTWRADVLASSHDGTQRVAWEAQLSPITNEDIQERTERYWAEGIGVCWVSPGGKAPWIGSVPSIRVQEPHDDQPWTVVDGPAAFHFEHGTWIVIDAPQLTAFIGWVLHEQTIVHRVRSRYRRIWYPTSEGYRRRNLIWTTSRHIDTETRHEAMRQRQEERKRQREKQERRAEQQRQAEAEARRIEEERQREVQRQEQERQRKIREAEMAVRWEEQQRQRAIEAEQARRRREAEERQRQEQARAAEEQRLWQEQREHQMAVQWWAELSHTQIQELQDAVAEPLWKKQATRAEFDTQGASADNAYGIAIYIRRRLHGILRPSPASLHRLPAVVPVFVRNAREAHDLINTGNIEPARVVHFNLPDHEQMSLM
ncbi:competence protein CoiA family protein [Salinispora pacifica]|uniref:competence protein CoiA family protein n=1 Tax=Salinispora pacifica TaxID=351187 RepID=UPI0004AFA9D9|nr:competence protein CoiA family protein [Salinispora pacifica]